MRLLPYMHQQGHDVSDMASWSSGLGAYDFWHCCHKPDWLLWVAMVAHADPRLIVLCGTGCVRPVLPFVKRLKKEAHLAVSCAEDWAYGRCTHSVTCDATFRLFDKCSGDLWEEFPGAEAIASMAAFHAGAAAAGCGLDNAAQAAHMALQVYLAAPRRLDDRAARRVTARCLAFARGVRAVIPWKHVADGLAAEGVELQ